MPRAKKTQTTKKKEPTIKQLVKQEVQKQLEEALLNIEFDTPESECIFLELMFNSVG